MVVEAIRNASLNRKEIIRDGRLFARWDADARYQCRYLSVGMSFKITASRLGGSSTTIHW
jgi:hypothetical protein